MLFKLAFKELSFDRMMSCCQVAAIACILAPLLLLFSLRYGVLQEMEQRLLNDPKILSLSLDTSYRLDNNFFSKLRARPEVGYVIPEISALNALVDLKVPSGVARMSVMATSLGDPIVIGSGIPYSQKQDALRMGHTIAKDATTTTTTTTQESMMIVDKEEEEEALNSVDNEMARNGDQEIVVGLSDIASDRDAQKESATQYVASKSELVVKSEATNLEAESAMAVTPTKIVADLEAEIYECFITQKVMKKYNLNKGDTVTLMVRRIKNKQTQVSRLPVLIRGVILDRFVNDDCILLPSEVVTALDDYRNGYEPDIFSDGSAKPKGTRFYAKFRLYAKDLDSVIPLYYHLAQHQFNVRSKVQEIENLQAVDRVLNFVFGVVALVSLVGGAIALGGLMLSSLKAKKRNLVLLRLMGQAPHDTYLLVLLEAVIIALCGFVLALALYYSGSLIFNQYFKQMIVGMVISELIWQHVLCFFAATIMVSGLTALWTAKYLLLRVHIADILREA